MPEARHAQLPCGFGRGCQDCEEHVHECIARPAFRFLCRALRAVLEWCGFSADTATAFIHYPEVHRDLRRNEVPAVWREAFPELLADKKIGKAPPGLAPLWRHTFRIRQDFTNLPEDWKIGDSQCLHRATVQVGSCRFNSLMNPND